MSIQKCNNCKKTFSWREIYKSLMIAYRPITCSECKTKHEIAFASRILISFVIVLPLVIFLFLIPDQRLFSTFTIVAFYIMYFILTSSIFPFLVKYRAY